MPEDILEGPGPKLGNSRRRILQTLLHAAEPLAVDQLARGLGISRNATYQHVTALERDGLIERAKISQTKGRPGQTYRLTDAGRGAFPKHYALIATMLIKTLRTRLGAAELEALLIELGQSLADGFADRFEDLDEAGRMEAIAEIMRELGYESEAAERADGEGLEIRAHNCVFHDLARDHREVCSLDIALLSKLAGQRMEHAECMVRGGHCCRFRVARQGA